MWMVSNQTPYAADRSWVRDKDGRHLWMVAVKATFDIEEGGRLRLADEQEKPLLLPEYWGEDGLSSLRYEADLGPPKPGTDVLVNGSAYAPGGKPAPRVAVSLRVNRMQKNLVVYGERVYYDGGFGLTTSSPEPFLTKPVVYERAYGGMDREDPDPSRHTGDPRNPVGRGFARFGRSPAGQPAPNVEYPEGLDPGRGPAGFGAVTSYWSPRRELGGTYDQRWMDERRPLLPSDYDPRHELCSPLDQRVGAEPIRGEAEVEVVHMSERAVLRFTLPKIYLTYTTHFGSRREEHRGRLVTVVVEPDRPRVLLVWQSHLLVRPRDLDYLDQTVVKEKPYLT